MSLFVSFLLVVAFSPWVGFTHHEQDDYRVTVTREDSDLYRVLGEDMFVRTRSCYEYVYFEDSLLQMSGRTGSIVFLDNGRRCDVAGVYGRDEIDAGVYTTTISRVESNWYRLGSSTRYAKTSLCLSLALGEEVTLRLSRGGVGQMIFSGPGSQYKRPCQVSGLYSGRSL